VRRATKNTEHNIGRDPGWHRDRYWPSTKIKPNEGNSAIERFAVTRLEMQQLPNVCIAPFDVICELGSGTGKDSIMLATRPAGCSVFLVEDEVMIRMMVADMLEELGHSVVAEAGEIGEAVKLAQSTDFDLAILDVNVNGKVITPVAELINARNRPFIFATGYGSSGLPPEYRDRPALQKPFQLETLAQVIASAMKRAPV
jgi:CheY-like chemotaxis protein